MTYSLGKKFASLRKEHRYLQSEVLEKLNDLGYPVAAATYSRWETGKAMPQADQFLALCRIYNIHDALAVFTDAFPTLVDPLSKEGRGKVIEFERILVASKLYARGSNVIPYHKRTRPVYEEDPVSAGTGQFLDSPDYTMTEIDDDVPDCVNFGVRVTGDSMEPAIQNGQIVWVQQQPTLENGEIGIFVLNGQSFVKKLFQGDQGVSLISLNPKYAPISIHAEDDLRVFGKVIL